MKFLKCLCCIMFMLSLCGCMVSNDQMYDRFIDAGYEFETTDKGQVIMKGERYKVVVGDGEYKHMFVYDEDDLLLVGSWVDDKMSYRYVINNCQYSLDLNTFSEHCEEEDQDVLIQKKQELEEYLDRNHLTYDRIYEFGKWYLQQREDEVRL